MIILFNGLSMSAMSLIVFSIAIYVENYEISYDPEEAGQARALAFVALTATQLCHSFLARSVKISVFNKYVFLFFYFLLFLFYFFLFLYLFFYCFYYFCLFIYFFIYLFIIFFILLFLFYFLFLFFCFYFFIVFLFHFLFYLFIIFII